MNKRKLTESYIQAFNDKNTDKVLSLCSKDIYLKDPSNEIYGQAQLKSFLKDFFKNDISFCARGIIVGDEKSRDHSVIHFSLTVNDERFAGVDIIQWEGEKIISLVAYL